MKICPETGKDFPRWSTLLPASLPTPCFVVDEARLAVNLAVLDYVRKRCKTRILLALKAFAMFSVFPLLRESLDGVCASSPFEARLGREEFAGAGQDKEVHVFAAAYSEADVRELAQNADHIIFNSFAQLERFAPRVKEWATQKGRTLEFGLRVNPEHSEGTNPLYDPCRPDSRLGIRARAFAGQNRKRLAGLGVTGLHFHALCEQDAAPLARMLMAVEDKFADWLPAVRWLNCGGGHHITRPGYDLELLCRSLERIAGTYGPQIYLEPGEAVALNAGVLAARVLDVVEADMPVAVLDASAAAHMPDVLEMPYRPEVEGAGEAGEKAWTCRLAGNSCLAGDAMGEYSFAAPLKAGDLLIFLDMAHYSMVKTNTFNGLGLPGIARIEKDSRRLRMVREFGYEDFKSRLS